jgi:hypothetical protein
VIENLSYNGKGTSMATLHNFKDNNTGCYSNLRMSNGDPCFVSVAQTGIMVKRSKLGILGPKIYENRDLVECADVAKALTYLYPEDRLPTGFNNPVLKAITNAGMHCETLAEVTAMLNEAISTAEEKAGKRINDIYIMPL